MNVFQNIYNTLDNAVQKATATPELAQGMLSNESRTATELNMANDKVSTRYSLMVKNMNMGEVEFWNQWYMSYKTNMQKDIDKKIVRVAGIGTGLGQFRPFTKENLIMQSDPDVTVVSKILSDARKQRQLNKFVTAMQVAMSDPEANKRQITKDFL